MILVRITTLIKEHRRSGPWNPCPVCKLCGPDAASLSGLLESQVLTFFYGVPNSQNPSGITYSGSKRREIAGLLADAQTLFIEDDAYGELRFDGTIQRPVSCYMPGFGIMTGSFSKIFSPGMRLGWVYAPEEIMDRLITVKQATDLHSNYLCQRILARYLENHDIDAHILRINDAYQTRAEQMVRCMERLFPADITFTKPKGGMFIWVTFPEDISSMELFDNAAEHNVLILPGHPFYVDGGGDRTARFNFSNADPEAIASGIEIIAGVIEELRQ